MTQKTRILIIEDNQENREYYRRLLEQESEADLEFFEASSGRDGIELCQSEQPDCVLLDCHLSDFRSSEVLDRLAGEQSAVRMPVVVLVDQENEGGTQGQWRGDVLSGLGRKSCRRTRSRLRCGRQRQTGGSGRGSL